MTSFTKALYRRDPAAAEAFYEQQRIENRMQYGRHPTLPQFTLAFHTPAAAAAAPHPVPTFGRRPQPPHGRTACTANCGHPACSNGCTAR